MRLDIHYYLYPLLIFPTYYKILHLHYLPPTKEEVYVFPMFVCPSVIKITQKREHGFG